MVSLSIIINNNKKQWADGDVSPYQRTTTIMTTDWLALERDNIGNASRFNNTLRL